MEREKVLILLRSCLPKLRTLGVRSVAVFGSTAREESSAHSDVDVLIEFTGRATFDKYMDVKFLLESTLGMPVDVVTPRALKPRMKPFIEQEAIYVT